MKFWSRCLLCKKLLIHWPWKSYANIKMYCQDGCLDAVVCKHCEKVCESYSDAMTQMLKDDEKDKLLLQGRDVPDGDRDV